MEKLDQLNPSARTENNQWMQCCNCHQTFDLNNATPYKLPCGHTACKKCLRACHKEKRDFTCKVDHTLVTLEQLKGLSKNLDVIAKLRERGKSAQGSSNNINQFPIKARQNSMKRDLLDSSDAKSQATGSTPMHAQTEPTFNNDMTQVKLDFKKSQFHLGSQELIDNKSDSNFDNVSSDYKNTLISQKSLANRYNSGLNKKYEENRIDELPEEDQASLIYKNKESLVRHEENESKQRDKNLSRSKSPLNSERGYHKILAAPEEEKIQEFHMQQIKRETPQPYENQQASQRGTQNDMSTQHLVNLHETPEAKAAVYNYNQSQINTKPLQTEAHHNYEQPSSHQQPHYISSIPQFQPDEQSSHSRGKHEQDSKTLNQTTSEYNPQFTQDLQMVRTYVQNWIQQAVSYGRQEESNKQQIDDLPTFINLTNSLENPTPSIQDQHASINLNQQEELMMNGTMVKPPSDKIQIQDHNYPPHKSNQVEEISPQQHQQIQQHQHPEQHQDTQLAKHPPSLAESFQRALTNKLSQKDSLTNVNTQQKQHYQEQKQDPQHPPSLSESLQRALTNKLSQKDLLANANTQQQQHHEVQQREDPSQAKRQISLSESLHNALTSKMKEKESLTNVNPFLENQMNQDHHHQHNDQSHAYQSQIPHQDQTKAVQDHHQQTQPLEKSLQHQKLTQQQQINQQANEEIETQPVIKMNFDNYVGEQEQQPNDMSNLKKSMKKKKSKKKKKKKWSSNTSGMGESYYTGGDESVIQDGEHRSQRTQKTQKSRKSMKSDEIKSLQAELKDINNIEDQKYDDLQQQKQQIQNNQQRITPDIQHHLQQEDENAIPDNSRSMTKSPLLAQPQPHNDHQHSYQDEFNDSQARGVHHQQDSADDENKSSFYPKPNNAALNQEPDQIGQQLHEAEMQLQDVLDEKIDSPPQYSHNQMKETPENYHHKKESPPIANIEPMNAEEFKDIHDPMIEIQQPRVTQHYHNQHQTQEEFTQPAYGQQQMPPTYQQPSQAQSRKYVPPDQKFKSHKAQQQQQQQKQQVQEDYTAQPHTGSQSQSLNQAPSTQLISRNETPSTFSLTQDKPKNKIQDGTPPFNQSVGKQNFQAFASQQLQKQNNQTPQQKTQIQPSHHPQMSGSSSQPPKYNQPLSKTAHIPPLQTPIIPKSSGQKFQATMKSSYQENQPRQQMNVSHQQEEIKSVDPSDILLKSQKSEGNLGHFKAMNNFLKSEQSFQAEEVIPPELRDLDNMPEDENQMSDLLLQQNQGNVHQFESLHDNYEGSQPPSRQSSGMQSRPQNRYPSQTEEILTPIDSQMQDPQMRMVRPLQEFCRLHPKEVVKYFCRDPNCLKGLCPDCIIEHSKHDFLAANELAALEIKQVIKQAQRKCKNQVRLQKEIKATTEKKLSQLNRQRSEEFQRLHCYFIELHKDLDEREAELNAMFNDEIKDVESTLIQDLYAIQQQYNDNVKLFKQLKILYDQFGVSTEVAVVGSAEYAYALSSQTIAQNAQNANRQFYIQQEEAKQDVLTPSFYIHLNNEKDRMMKIGRIIAGNAQDQPEQISSANSDNEAIQINVRTADSGLSMIPEESKSVQDSRHLYSIRQSGDNFAKSHSKKIKDQSHNTRDNWTQTSDQMSMQIISSSPIPNTPHQQQPHVSKPPLQGQQLQRSDTQAYLNNYDAVYLNIKNMHWFKWDSNEVYRYNLETKDWNIRAEVKNQSKFLFFSSLVHLPNDQGCFILGGSDNEDNYSKRVQYFCKYNLFIEKPPMINKRAFFPSVFARLDNSIYVLGGSDSNQTDLNKCEKFSLIENVWRPIASMSLHRNGTGAVILEQYRLIFVFGGNNHKHGSLTKIEKYEIDFDKWTMIDICLKTAIHDLTALCIGRERVMIFGGHTNTEPNKEMQLVDLSLECFKTKIGKSKLMLKEGGKTYFPPCFDQQNGKVHIVFGYCDDKPKIEELDISELALSNYGNFVKPTSEANSRRDSQSKMNPAAQALIERRSQSLNRTGVNPIVEF